MKGRTFNVPNVFLTLQFFLILAEQWIEFIFIHRNNICNNKNDKKQLRPCSYGVNVTVILLLRGETGGLPPVSNQVRQLFNSARYNEQQLQVSQYRSFMNKYQTRGIQILLLRFSQMLVGTIITLRQSPDQHTRILYCVVIDLGRK